MLNVSALKTEHELHMSHMTAMINITQPTNM